jgi:ribosome-binding protein aMBF1 (putative translation factor)
MGSTIRTKEYAIFIERMIKARHDAGLRQVDVAKKMKRPQSYISRVESGEYRLDILEVKRFAQLYGKSVEYFLK